MITNKHYYSFHYTENELSLAIEEVADYLAVRIDFTDPVNLIEKREDIRLLFSKINKAFLTLDYINKKSGTRSGEEYAMYSSLRNYCELLIKNLETTTFSISNALNYFKHER